MTAAPAIRITLGARTRIDQHRFSVPKALTGRPLDEALRMVPLLLPICGVAQSVAALRAMEAAEDRDVDPTVEHIRDTALAAEQAISVAWRHAIDWPPLIGFPADPVAILPVRAAMAPLMKAAEGVLRRNGVASPAAKADCNKAVDVAVTLAESPMPARIAAALEHAPDDAQDRSLRLSGETAAAAAYDTLTRASFDPLAPSGGPIEVGPLAGRADAGSGVRARFAAASAQAHEAADRLAAPPATHEPVRIGDFGIGAAMTARGPVFHAIAIEDGRVADWRAIAPTDWHFAPDGPCAAALDRLSQADRDQGWARWTAASFDPCAQWEISPGGDPHA